MSLLKVCYLSTGIMDTAFDSQVLPLLEKTLLADFDLIHISFDPFYGKATKCYLEKKQEIDSIGIKTLHLRQTPVLAKLSLIVDEKRIRNAFVGWWGRKGKLVIHCRGHFNAYRGLLLKKRNPELISVVADLRGAVTDEVIQQAGGLGRKFLAIYLRGLYQRIEGRVVRNADIILCVSYAFKRVIQAKHNVENITVIPTFVDTSRFMFSESLRRSFRDDLGISGRTVLVYSGGVASWQKIGNVISLFNYLKPKVSNLFMLFLTHEPYLLEGMIKGQIHPGDLKVLSVPHREVGAYLCAADVGVLLRENTLTNHVASPIKFGEYMCCGLPCILSSNIGDTAEIIHKGNAGIILNKDNGFPSITEFRRLLSLDRKEIADSMRQKFASDIFISKILTIYQDLAKSEK